MHWEVYMKAVEDIEEGAQYTDIAKCTVNCALGRVQRAQCTVGKIVRGALILQSVHGARWEGY